MSSDGVDEKHLNLEDRRRRWDPASKYGGYSGKSVVRAMPVGNISVQGYSDIFLKIRRPTDEDGNVLVSELDKEMHVLLCDVTGRPWGGHNQVKGSTDVKRREMGPGGHWFRLPELLEQQCVSKSTARDPACGSVIVTTYSVKGISWMAPNEEERTKLQQRREGRLTLAHADGHRVFCRLADAPLERIPDKTLLDAPARLVAQAVDEGTPGALPWECNPQQAKVLQESHSSCWCAPTGDGRRASDEYLEVDLGASCRVTWVSTQGRFPPISHTDRETGIRVIQEGSPAFRNWVESYELSYRVVSGHQWIVLGELKANSDMTTEVAHELAQVAKEPVQCRYLRFRPLKYEGLPAMRVGVYGERLEGPSRGRVEPGGDAQLIQYTICRVKEQANLRWATVGCSFCRNGCAKCSKNTTHGGGCKAAVETTISARRKRLRQGALEEVQRLGGEQSAPAWAGIPEAPGDDSAAPNDGDVPPAPAPPGPGALSRQRSFSDPELSRASPSSAGDSYVVVDTSDPDFLAALDSDDWLVV